MSLTIELLPGVKNLNPALLIKFKEIRERRGPTYRPRTRHLNSDGWALFTNRLFLEKSPYLLQHAHNPVNWYSWGEEAFKEAKNKDKPVLLSVGYSTCHWCHVMEEESFEDLEIARYINENYIAVKVDREERPDIDSVYMNAVQMITGHGGWPMTVWLTPHKQIFYGGTYFPPRTGNRGSSFGFLSLLKEIKKVYEERRENVTETGQEIKKALQNTLSPAPLSSYGIPDKKVFESLYLQVKNRWDPVYGGIKGAPKFPSSFPTHFILRSYLKVKDQEILKTIQASLNGMLKGGIHDHVGGGFHRYSTDEKWLVPHFEKMLYDQALLAVIYLEAYQLFKVESYKETAVGILDYIIRDMQSKEGGFYSATDADSLVYKNNHSSQENHPSQEGRSSQENHPSQEGRSSQENHPSQEGRSSQESYPSQKSCHSRGSGNPENNKLHKKKEGFYFTWTPREIDQVLDKKSAELIKKYYGVTSSGNFDGRNIFYISKELSEVAKDLQISVVDAKKILDSARKKLYEARQLRPLPSRDEKILSGWNGLMISAFVYGYFVLNEKKYLLQAKKSARFILNNMRKKDHLYRSWKEGEAYVPAYLDDYAFFTSALLDLFEWTGEIKWLKGAIELDQVLEKSFEDKERGGFFMTGRDYEQLLVREKPFYDGAEPSGNSVAIMNLLRLSDLTVDKKYRIRAEKAFRSFSITLEKAPFSFSEALVALDYYYSRVSEIVVVLPDGVKPEEDPLFNELKKWYLPNKVLIVVSHSEVENRQRVLPSIKMKKAMEGKTTVYICEKGTCQFPTSDLKELKRQLKETQSFPRKRESN